MTWEKMTLKQRIDWLNHQLEEIRRARAVIDSFEQVTRKWLKKAQAQEAKKAA